jgi:hypothetical protein
MYKILRYAQNDKQDVYFIKRLYTFALIYDH